MIMQPAAIEIRDSHKQLVISWHDASTTTLPFAKLRGFCPCAMCQGHGGETTFVAPPDNLQLLDVHEVGHYALNLVWADGHRTGIYTFEWLHKIGLMPPA